MSAKYFSTLILAGSLVAASADEKLPILPVGGMIYTNVTVTKVSATDVFFTYAGGLVNVKIKNLSPDLQKHFHFDPTKAGKVEQQQAENKVKYHGELLKHPPTPRSSDVSAVDKAPPATAKKIWAKSLLNQKAPDLFVEKWLTDQPDCRGKFILIDFWATWCPPCRAAIPELNSFHEKFGDKLVVIGISEETEQAVRRLTDPQIKYSIAIDTQARTKKAIEVTGIPHVLIIDPQGFVRWEGFPFLEGYELNEKVVADILARYSN